MKIAKTFLAIAFLSAATVFATVFAADKTTEKPKPYPLTTCVTDGEKLGSMGQPYVFTFEGREIKLCCSGCEAEFKKNSAKYIKKLEAAEKKKNQK